MNTLDRADAYLAIPLRDGADRSGLWWSSNRAAVERRDSTTRPLANEVGAVLEGALAKPPVPPFAFVLDLLRLMKVKAAGFDGLHGPSRRRGVAARGRAFARCVDESGRAELGERFKCDFAVPRSFRADLVAAEAARTSASPAPPRRWRGQACPQPGPPQEPAHARLAVPAPRRCADTMVRTSPADPPEP